MDTRPPPPQGPPPSYAFVTRMYKSSLRPIVVFTATIAAIWAISSSVGDFRNFGIDRTHNVPKLALFSVVLGAIYMGVFVIELFGLLSALSNRTRFVRVYAYLTILSALVVIAAGLLEIVIHFTLKNDIINICSELTDGEEIIYYGFFGPVYHTVIDQAQAVQFCNDSWNHDSWVVIVTLLLTGFLAVFFSTIVFAYLHQLMDPTSPANAARAPAYLGRMQANPLYYNPPYNTAYNGPYEGQNYNDYYAARAPAYEPSGPPPPMPERDDPFVPPDDAKPPSYSGNGLGFGAGDNKDDSFSAPERDVTSSTRDRF